MIDVSKIAEIEIDGIDHSDYPDYSDAYISFVLLELEDGKFRELTEEECNQLQEENPTWFYEKLMDRIN